MTMNSMSVAGFVDTAVKLPPTTSVLVRGNHGIGKSQIMRALARAVAVRDSIAEFPVIDRRLSQVTEGDILGLPSTDGEVTRFNPPDWYKLACERPVFLFLDELNRATPEVMQAAFQIVLDRELNGWRLHPKTRVMSAINASANYTVNEVDPALLDRFWVVDLVPEASDWLAWARQQSADPDPSTKAVKALFGGLNCLPLVTDYMADQSNAERWLDPPRDVEPGSVHTSRRSWERLGDALAYAGVATQPENSLFYTVCMGFVGPEAALKFIEFARTADRFTGEDIMNNYAKVRQKIIAQKRAETFNDAIEKVVAYINKQGKVQGDKQTKNLKAFAEDLPDEHCIDLWSKLTEDGVDNMDKVLSVHAAMVHRVVTGIFGVPVGEKGIGVTPNIPGMFRQDGDKDKTKGTKKSA